MAQIHRPRGIKTCLPIRVKETDSVGRFLVATRDLEPLDLILSDIARPSGPPHDDTIVCLTCYTPVPEPEGKRSICTNCGLAFCSTQCCKDEIHTDQECRLFQKRNLYFNVTDKDRHPVYRVIQVNHS